jgi:Acyclic terpene utilisation family protein AtuA
MTASEKIIRIGCASGFWGDSAIAAPQLLRGAALDYLVLDYLAEVTMSLLARARMKDADAGYAIDFVSVTMKGALKEISRQGVKVVANAGGVNPHGCKRALEALAAEAGVKLRVAVVEGDDLMPRIDALSANGVRELYSGASLPAEVLTANAYLGALPIAAALAAGADVVVTGRCVDSALTLGVLMHEFAWRTDDYDRLATGSLAGHVLECGPQATGGLHTDWDEVEDWANIGYPVVECRSDGAFVLTKPDGTGGLVTPATTAEQVLYEVGDPAAYLLPDVTADFSHVRVEPAGRDRVRVSGARGGPPTAQYKVSATYQDGWRCVALVSIVGIDAAAKAEKTAAAILGRTRGVFRARNLPDFAATHVEVLGAEASFGPQSRARGSREVVLRLVADHPQREALELFAREIAPAGTSWAPGTTGFMGGRPSVQPVVKLFTFLIDKSAVPPPRVQVGDAAPVAVAVPTHGGFVAKPNGVPTSVEPVPSDGPTIEVPLIRLAYARSGDKADTANIAVIARKPEYLPLIRRELTPARVAAHFSHLVKGPVQRFEAPGLNAFNFVLAEALGGGGMASQRIDPQGKAYAQMALEIPISVPQSLKLD